MKLNELTIKESTYTLSKKCSIDLSKIAKEVSDKILSDNSIGNYEFECQNGSMYIGSNRNFKDAAKSACNTYCQRNNTSYARLKLTKAEI